MRHTFLLETGDWEADGNYLSADQSMIPVAGKVKIRHHSRYWTNEGSMKLLLEPTVEFFNHYQIQPFSFDSDLTTWVSENPDLGKMHGVFVIVGDCIMSKYATVDGVYSGGEVLRQIDANTYENRGFALRGNEKLSSWVVRLTRVVNEKME